MKHTVQIDDRNPTGKHLLNLLITLSKKNPGIDFISDSPAKNEEADLIQLMKEGIKSGLADKKTVLKKLRIQ